MLSTIGLGAVALVVGLILRHYGKYPRVVLLLGLVAGFLIGGGLLGHLLFKLGSVFAHVADVGSSRLFGVGVPVVLVIAMIAILVLEFMGKTPGKGMFWMALLLPAVLAVSGGVWAQLGQHGVALSASLGQAIQQLFAGVLQGW